MLCSEGIAQGAAINKRPPIFYGGGESMPEVVGLITDLESKPTSRGGTNHRFTIEVDGQKVYMSCFDDKAFGQVKVGNTYKLKYDEKPNPQNAKYPYKNITAWELVEGGAAPTSAAPAVSIDHRIAWNSAVNNAVQLLVAEQLNAGEATAEQIKTKAQMVYAIILGGPGEQSDSSEQVTEPVEPKVVVPEVEQAADVEYRNTSEALSALNAARLDGGMEKLAVPELAKLCKETFDGKHLRELTVEQITKLIPIVKETVANA